MKPFYILLVIITLSVSLGYLREKKDNKAWAIKSLMKTMGTIRGLESLIDKSNMEISGHIWEIRNRIKDALMDDLLFYRGESRKSPDTKDGFPSVLRMYGYEHLGDSSFDWIRQVCELLFVFANNPAFLNAQREQKVCAMAFDSHFRNLLRLCPTEILKIEDECVRSRRPSCIGMEEY